MVHIPNLRKHKVCLSTRVYGGRINLGFWKDQSRRRTSYVHATAIPLEFWCFQIQHLALVIVRFRYIVDSNQTTLLSFLFVSVFFFFPWPSQPGWGRERRLRQARVRSGSWDCGAVRPPGSGDVPSGFGQVQESRSVALDVLNCEHWENGLDPSLLLFLDSPQVSDSYFIIKTRVFYWKYTQGSTKTVSDSLSLVEFSVGQTYFSGNLPNARNVSYCLFHGVHYPHQHSVDTPVSSL